MSAGAVAKASTDEVGETVVGEPALRPVPTGSSLRTLYRDGRVHHLHLQSMVPDEAVLSDLDRTALAVESCRLDVFAILEREKAELKSMIALVENRRYVGRALLERLDAEIAELSGVLLDEISSSINDDLSDSDRGESAQPANEEGGEE